ncbi:hypothetical protein MKX01_038856 [Papaver californicum]|nr:hypothetical protein MKX01_038856 [Papaver californicum]
MISAIQNPRIQFLFQCRYQFNFPPKARHFHRSTVLLNSASCSSQVLTEKTLTSTSPPTSEILTIRKSFYLKLKKLILKIERNEDLGVLAGVLIGVKDNICTVGMPSTGGSRILQDYRPAYDATAVKKLKQSGALLVGKTNLDEFGMGTTTEGSGFQVTANPWDVSRVPGGSSGGSAAAVSARQCVAALGSDTGGSVRQPASFCGVVGMKPTYGRVSRLGLMAYASSLDVIGCLEVPSFAAQFISTELLESKPLKGLRVGIIRETLGDGVDKAVVSTIKAAASHLEELGCTVTEVSLPSFSLGLPAYYILASSESSSNLSRYDGVRKRNSLYSDSRSNGFGSEVKMRILMGKYALSAGYYDAYYKRAQQVRILVQKSFKDALRENGILISPAAPSAAYKIGAKKNDPLAMYAGDIMTVNVNLAGLPALVLPCGFAEGGPAGLPIGLQMIGGQFDEGKFLRVGHIFEQTLQGGRFIPPLVV